MKPDWKEFLIDAGAELEDNAVAHFGTPERERQMAMTGNVFCDLSHRGLIAVHGEDAGEFLQSQLSNDLEELTGDHSSQLSGLCNAKGRLFALFRVYRRDHDGYYLDLPRDHVENTLKRLHMYVLRARVSLEDACERFVRMGVSGPTADRELQEVLGGIPQETDHIQSQDGLAVIRLPGPHPRFELMGELDPARRLWDRLNVRCAPVGPDAWRLLDIAAGVPTILPATAEQFVPQMVNLDIVGGVSFSKGCYPGQEVVARMHYLGRLKRRMYRLHTSAGERPVPGTALYDAAARSGQSVGQVVDARPDPDSGYQLLAVLQIDRADSGELRLGGRQSPRLTRLELPYSLDIRRAADTG